MAGSESIDVEIALLIVSPVHRYEGRPADGPLPSVGEETPDRIELRARLGVVGDRYFNKAAHSRAAVTLMAMESVEQLVDDLALEETPDPRATRRNILLRGANVDALRGTRFTLDSGHGPVEFQGNRPANPCAWMNVTLAPGAFKALRGRGGIRATPLTDGVLTLGPAVLTRSEPAD
ncbi:MOSC domain-containing protein [Amnibacterium flavum]|uniref:Molybdenum cofactor biosysynthesis protein n=1 Tax=Amnibacterium flavum TaxID=2173173 RepID=A0A2V1HLF3_9MICO|nr:MOSC domain-containing protein [Amnibacterium flavum]PVZ93453.1 molybdenum cofactor biosysynthesis protein [Amnibacterium flavum]